MFNFQFLNGVGGFLLKSAAGRVIVNHVGSEDGFLVGGSDVFICKKDCKDYHKSMNSDCYLEWFKRILELLPQKSVIVVDLAPYHRKRVESSIMPNSAWRKQRIIDWLVQKGVQKPAFVTHFEKLTKVSLIQLAKCHPVKTKYVIEELAEQTGKDIKVLWLPPGHCELNPIELVWAFVKSYVSTNNTGKNIQHILTLTNEALSKVTPELWKNCIRHTTDYENKMWNRDRLIDLNLFNDDPISTPSFIIPVGNDSSSSEDSDSDSE